jgi:hypothetical protein
MIKVSTYSKKSKSPGQRPVVFVFLVVAVSLLLPLYAVGGSHSPGKYRNWNGMDEVEILQPFKISDYSRLIVLPLDTSPAKLPPRDDNTYKPVRNVLSNADQVFIEGLEDEIDNKLKVVQQEKISESDSEIMSGKVLILTGKITEINPGSRAARIWIGFGAGKSRVEIEGEIVDAKTQKTLLKFKQARAAAMDTRSYEKTLNNDLEQIGKDIGEMLLEF